MSQRNLDKDALGHREDWYGNNAAIQCPSCGKVYIASKFLNKGFRKCPKCGKSSIQVTDGKTTITSQE
jgi:Zn finger protein HypA/HybF involved in hydrogenase expression